ncbi:hypothetical protein T484DRAFT_1843706 [Baffinella frigidus]|nr:hypothetical protein T484DRAFT_1843706 [Cryptophyta sp. CCMP2293]
MRLAARAMRLAPVRARTFSTPCSTYDTHAAAVEFGVQVTGGIGAQSWAQSWAPLDAINIFVRADTDRCQPTRPQENLEFVRHDQRTRPANIGRPMMRRSGTLDKEQLGFAIVEIRGVPVPRERLEYLFCKLDLNGDGKIDYAEFVKGLGYINEGSVGME